MNYERLRHTVLPLLGAVLLSAVLVGTVEAAYTVSDNASDRGVQILRTRSQVHPRPSNRPEAATLRGWASYYNDGPGLYGAVHSWHWHDKPYPVQVCSQKACVVVIVRDFCACGKRHGTATVIDLSPLAFSKIAPLSRGIVRVTVRGISIKPPATDTVEVVRIYR